MISHILNNMLNTYGTLPRDKLKFMLAVLDCDIKLLRSQGEEKKLIIEQRFYVGDKFAKQASINLCDFLF